MAVVAVLVRTAHVVAEVPLLANFRLAANPDGTAARRNRAMRRSAFCGFEGLAITERQRRWDVILGFMSDSRLAIHGAGHLTAALVEGCFRTQIGPISLFNRTRERAADLARLFPIIRVFEDQAEFESERCPL